LKRRLLLLNVVLLLLAALAGWQLRREYLAARERESAVLKRTLKPAPAPPAGKPQARAPVAPGSYLDIAQKLLFSKDRNSVVVEEPPAPPPPKPVPPMPVFHGMMNLGDGPIAILSEKAGGQHREFHPGDQVGPFKLLAFNKQEVVLEWDGKTITKSVQELMGGAEEPRQEAAAPAAANTAAPPPPHSQQSGPGVELTKGTHACIPNDTTPAGTVRDGFRKTVTETPFGPQCRWEQIQ
jgi:hypothetical protein